MTMVVTALPFFEIGSEILQDAVKEFVADEWIETPQSSCIARFKYNVESEVLTIEFQSGGQYDYPMINIDTVSGLNDATSKGHYFFENIRRRD